MLTERGRKLERDVKPSRGEKEGEILLSDWRKEPNKKIKMWCISIWLGSRLENKWAGFRALELDSACVFEG